MRPIGSPTTGATLRQPERGDNVEPDPGMARGAGPGVERQTAGTPPGEPEAATDGAVHDIFATAAERLPQRLPASPVAFEPWMMEPPQSPSGASEASTSSVQSSFADRPGFVNPPDTLSFGVTDNRDIDQRLFLDMVNLAIDKNLSLHIDVRSSLFDAYSRTLSRTNLPILDLGNDHRETRVFQNSPQGTTITLQRQAVSPPNWPEDVMFMGNKSMHRLANEFSGPLGPGGQDGREAIIASRREGFEALNIPDAEMFARAMRTGNSAAEIDYVPAATKTYSTRSGQPTLRAIPQKRSISAAIEGGNILGNGAEPGRRKFIVGLDSVALTQAHMQSRSPQTSFDEAKEQVRRELQLAEGDTVTFVEQPSFHLDMTMSFCGENEVVLNDSKQYFELRQRNHSENPGIPALNVPLDEMEQNAESYGKIEDSIQADLENMGITVHRKPWASEDRLTTFFNTEIVKTNDDKRLLICGDFFQKGNSIALSKRDVDDLKADFRVFYAARGVDVEFLSQAATGAILTKGGGLGCKVNGMRS